MNVSPILTTYNQVKLFDTWREAQDFAVEIFKWSDGKPQVRRAVRADGQIRYVVKWRLNLQKISPSSPRSVWYENCTCPQMWLSVLPPPPCPVHGQLQMTRWISTTSDTTINPRFSDRSRHGNRYA